MLNKFMEKVKFWTEKLKKYQYRQQGQAIVQCLEEGLQKINSWPKVVAVAISVIFVLYYPLGALISEDIDTNIDYEILKNEHESAVVDMMSFLIKREVYQKSWTPALPFVFPASMLDNMPAFQLGEISAIRVVANALADVENKIASVDGKSPMVEAAELLSYPGTIWMFSPTNKLVPAPSSNSQYRKARKQLQKYNQLRKKGRAFVINRPEDLKIILQNISNDLIRSSKQLEDRVREFSEAWWDAKSDDVFYFQKGKMYVYHLLLKSLAYDFKEVLLKEELYAQWTSLLKVTENAALTDPIIVRNSNLASIWGANHLVVMNYYTLKAAMGLQKMLDALTAEQVGGDR